MARFEFVAQQPLHAANLNQELNRTVQNRGDWQVGEAYVLNDLVRHGGIHWLALTDSIGSAPDDSNTDWAMFAGGDAAGADRRLSNLSDPAAARSNLGLGTSATRGVGTTVGTVAAGDDARFSRLELKNQGMPVTDNAGYVLEAIADPYNATTTALRLVPTNNSQHRLFLGTGAAKFYEVDFAGVAALANLPEIDLNYNYLRFGGTIISIQRVGVDIQYNTRYGDAAHLFYTVDGLSTRIGNLGLAVKVTAPHSTLHTGGSVAQGANTARTSATTLTQAHYALFYDTSGGSITQTLPDASGLDGREYAFFKGSGDAGTVTVSPPSGQGPTSTLALQYDSVRYRAFNGVWYPKA